MWGTRKKKHVGEKEKRMGCLESSRCVAQTPSEMRQTEAVTITVQMKHFVTHPCL